MKCPKCNEAMQLMNANMMLGMALTNFYCEKCNYNAADGDVLEKEVLMDRPLFAVSQIEEEGIAS